MIEDDTIRNDVMKWSVILSEKYISHQRISKGGEDDDDVR